MFIHTVYFWIKPGSPEGARDRLVQDCRDYLGRIPVVKQIWSGRPATTPRDVVDNSYDAGLTVILDDRAGHDAYQEHPLHADFVARNKPHWARVQVYDFVQAEGHRP